MGAVLAFLVGPIGRWLLIAGTVSVFFVVTIKRIEHRGWVKRDVIAQAEKKTWEEKDAERDRLEARRAAEAERLLNEERGKLEAYIADLDAKLSKENAKVAALQKTLDALYARLKKETTRYVTKESDDRITACGGIPRGFVLLHDRAARGDPAEAPLPETAGSEDLDRDSGIALSRVAEVMVDNAEKFHQCMTSLKAWEAWYPTAKGSYEALR